mmetsp:Transcript_39539/g.105110  ORF Transcript_39539/g.105110 Transcript_39539/m.105110 type:complete len:111 (-) Transcript_39539:525-857(-)
MGSQERSRGVRGIAQTSSITTAFLLKWGARVGIRLNICLALKSKIQSPRRYAPCKTPGTESNLAQSQVRGHTYLAWTFKLSISRAHNIGENKMMYEDHIQFARMASKKRS